MTFTWALSFTLNTKVRGYPCRRKHETHAGFIKTNVLSGRAPPSLDQSLECLAQLRILQLRQLDRFSRGTRHRAQFRPLPATQSPLHESQLAHGVIANSLRHAREDLRFHQVQFLYPHRTRHFHHRGVEFQRDDFRAARDRLADDLRPCFRQPHDREVTLAVDPVEQRLHRGTDLFGSLVASSRHERSTIAPPRLNAYWLNVQQVFSISIQRADTISSINATPSVTHNF